MERTRPRSGPAAWTVLLVASALLVASGLLAAAGRPALAQEPTVRLMTHDSFYLPEPVLASFEEAHGVKLELLPAGDAGSMVSQAILTADAPLADVLYGIDNTFLSRALKADIFQPFTSSLLEHVPIELQLDEGRRVTPIDFGDVCLNIDRTAFGEDGLPLPAALADLTDPAYAGQLVVEDPATSSPGLAFLLATIATFGEDAETGWQAFWAALRENDVLVASDWESAYYGAFSGGSGEGDRPIVVSYASSPAAEVAGLDPDAEAPTAAIDAGCFRQVEFAGILRGTEHPELAGALIDHLLSAEVQAEIPLAMYVYPARTDIELPEPFAQHARMATAPVTLSPEEIDVGREAWIDAWTEVVLR